MSQKLKPSAYYFYVKTKIMSDFHICISVPRRLTRGGSGGDPPALFQKLEKSTLI